MFNIASRSKAFTLIELMFVIAISAVILSISIASFIRIRAAIEFKYAVEQVLSDVKLTQQLAVCSHENARIQFDLANQSYKIYRSGKEQRAASLSKSVLLSGKTYFSFVPSGYTDIGGSGTLSVTSRTAARKIIVSSKGRVRIEK